MKKYLLPNCFILFSYFFIAHPVLSQDSSLSAKHKPFTKAGLFESDEVLAITLKGDLHDLLKNRAGDAQYYPLTLSLAGKDSSQVSIPVNVKTRGHFRREKGNCDYPPLLISFSKEDRQSSALFGKMKLKLVMPCQGDEYVVREWLVYKLYNLVTPESFRARLVRVTLQDEKSKKDTPPFFGILLEEEQRMAKRNNAVSVTRKLGPEQTMPDAFLNMAVFEYLIGNTDWSVQYLQNVKLIAEDSMAIATAVPYDFDHSGIVNCPYAQPAEALQMSSVRQRRYRGYCIDDMKVFDSVIVHYNNLKNDIYTLYTGCPLLNEKYIKATLKYLDDFYATINNPKALKKEWTYPCDKNGTGNVVIKGLSKD